MRWTLLLLTICLACARQVPLTGGLKDLDPPELVMAQPENKTLNFEGSQIILEFDEYIKEENLFTQLLITPRFNGTYKSRVNKNRITLNFDQPFDSATTYTLNFREGIKDITESNVPDNLHFVFSTGSYLDSMAVSGSVRALLTQSVLEDVTISLYHTDNDSINLFNGTPLYSTKTESDGSYVLSNIKQGTYNIFAISDKNQNLKLESKDEGYSYLDSAVLIDDSIANVNFQIQNLDIRKLNLQSSRPVGKNYDLKFNKYIENYTLESEIPFESNLVEVNKTLRIYLEPSVTDSVALQFSVRDSTAQTIDSLVYVKFEESARRPDKFRSNLNLSKGSVNRSFQAILKLNKPSRIANPDSIYFQFDSLAQIPVPANQITVNKNKDQITFNITMDSLFQEDSVLTNWGKPFDFIISKASIISIEQDSIAKLERQLRFKDPEKFGLVSGSISTNHESFVLQLIDQDFQVIEELSYQNATTLAYQFAHIKPGEYSLRVFIDENSNSRWDPGNINDQILPEPVRLFFHANVNSAVITIRENWEQTGIDISF